MLTLLADKVAQSNITGLRGVIGDVGDPHKWPEGEFSAVVAAFNLIFNLGDEDSQRQAFVAARDHMSADGSLIVEAFVPAPKEESARPERNLELRSVTADSVTLIATEMDPTSESSAASTSDARHGEPLRLRPWHIRVATPAEMDSWASDVGLEWPNATRTGTGPSSPTSEPTMSACTGELHRPELGALRCYRNQFAVLAVQLGGARCVTTSSDL